jgi:hypothetical protein
MQLKDPDPEITVEFSATENLAELFEINRESTLWLDNDAVNKHHF